MDEQGAVTDAQIHTQLRAVSTRQGTVAKLATRGSGSLINMTEHGIPHNAPSIDCPQAQAHTQAFCGKRLSAAVSVALFFLLGAPVWYRTTQLHRMPLPFERMASTGARAAELPIRIRLWLCTDSVQAGSMPRQTDDHVARILGKLEQLGVSPFTEAGLSIHAVWVTPNGCQTADPLMLLTGEQYAKTGHLRSCPQVHRFVMGELGSDVAVETALQSSIHEIQAQAVGSQSKCCSSISPSCCFLC